MADVLVKTNNSRLVYLSDYLVVRKIADRVQAAPKERPNVVDLFKWQAEQVSCPLFDLEKELV